MANTKYLHLHPQDNVLVALQDLKKGSEILFEGSTIILRDDIPAKHKIFIQDMQPGDKVFMYGVLVGKVQIAIKAGELMTTANLHHATEEYAYRNVNFRWNAPDISKFSGRTLSGYHRKDGTVGTANYWLFVPTVFCENRNLDVIKEALHDALGYAKTDKYKSYASMLAESSRDDSLSFN